MYSFQNRRYIARCLAIFLIISIWIASAVPATTRTPVTLIKLDTFISAPATPPAVQKRAVRQQPTRPKSDLVCLAQAIYFEAGFEPIEGQEGVASVVFNRAGAGTTRKSLCKVVYAPFQFSWTADWSKWTKKPREEYLALAKELIAKRDEIRDTYRVTNFHHVDVTPKWAKNLEFVATYGQHHFYRPKTVTD